MEEEVTIHDILIFDYHGEYLSQLYDHKWHPDFARCFLVVDFNQTEEAQIGVDLNEAPLHIKEAFEQWNYGSEMAGGCIIKITGDIGDHRRLFDKFVTELLEGPQGADDDTFDYWPGAVETLEMYARELLKVDPDGPYRVAADRINANNIDVVPEWVGMKID